MEINKKVKRILKTNIHWYLFFFLGNNGSLVSMGRKKNHIRRLDKVKDLIYSLGHIIAIHNLKHCRSTWLGL